MSSDEASQLLVGAGRSGRLGPSVSISPSTSYEVLPASDSPSFQDSSLEQNVDRSYDSLSESHTQADEQNGPAAPIERDARDAPQKPSEQLPGEEKQPPGRTTLQRWFVDWWALEIISIACSSLSFLAMIGVLSAYSGLPLREWSAPVKINTAISLFSTLSKSTLLLAVSACIGQLKWQCFAQKPRRLADLQSFDEASRGPWGACDLLLRSRGGSVLVMFAASAVILTLAVDPFAQQVVSFPSGVVHNANESAFIFKAQSYDPGVPEINGLSTSAYTPLRMQGAIYRGVFDLRGEDMFYCPTADCDYPPFATLEVCSGCSDVTKDAQRTCYKAPNGTRLVPADEFKQQAPMACNYTLPRGFNLWAWSGMSGEGSFNTLVNASGWGQVAYSAPKISDMMILRLPELKGVTFDLPFGEIHHCEFYLCAKSYSNAKVRKGILDVSDVVQYNLKTTSAWYNPVFDGYETVLEVDGVPEEYDFNGTFTFNAAGFTSTGWFLTDLFTVAQSSYAANFNDPGRLNIGYALQMAPDIPKAIEKVARSISQGFRSGPNSTSHYGMTIASVPFIHVRWAWLILPAALVLSGVALLATLMVSTKRRNIALWKSSALALLFHGIPEDQLPNMAGGPAALHSVSDMERVADDFVVQLCNVNQDTRLLSFGTEIENEKLR